MRRGNTLANCFFNCGVMFGETPFASFSNSALVITVLQSAGEAFAAGAFDAVSDVAAAALGAAAFGVAGHTPITVITAASAGKGSEVSGGAGGGRLRFGGG